MHRSDASKFRKAAALALGAAFLCLSAVGVRSASGAVVAQAGSVGGSVGKSNKSLSGQYVEQPRGLLFPTGLDPAGDNWLALRSLPNGQGVRLLKMGPDTLMTLIGREGQWLHVRLETGQTGWALSKYLACCR